MRSMKLFFNGLILVSVMLIASCSEDEEKGPPTIGKVFPLAGSFDMVVTITGENFSEKPGGNRVRFNGIDAEIIMEKKDSLKVKVPRNGASGPVTLTIGDLASVGPDFRYFDIYIAGVEDNSVPKLWKNGIEQVIADSPAAYITALTLSGTDIYLTGHKLSAGVPSDFGYWVINETENSFVSLPNPTTIAGVSETFISSTGDVYVAGSGHDGPGETSVRYWKNNEVQTPDQLTYTNGKANAIAVSGTDVYLGGAVRDAGVHAAYWKNNDVFVLGDGTEVRDVQLSGSNVYMVASGTNETLPITYWKNGTSQTIVNSGRPTTASAMVIVPRGEGLEDDVYIVGSELFAETTVSGAKLWKNGIGAYIFNNNTIQSHAAGVAVLEDNVITAGRVLKDNVYQAYYSINGQNIYVTNGTKNITVTGLVVQ